MRERAGEMAQVRALLFVLSSVRLYVLWREGGIL